MILVTGEALIDLVISPDGSVKAVEGGGPYNAARTIGRLGQPVQFLACISQDRFGTGLFNHLVHDGVDPAATVRTRKPTTLAAAELDEHGSASYRFYFEGTAAPALASDVALANVPGDVQAFHVGTLGLVMEPLATAAEAIVASLPPSVLVFLDPNCRPLVVEDPVAYRARVRALYPRADVVKVSEEDLEFLDPTRSADDAARDIIAAGARVVLLSAGGEGVRIFTSAGVFAVPATKVTVVDTIGAGDSLGGSFLAWWIARGLTERDLGNHDLLRQAATFATYVAARTCAVSGAQPPLLAELPDALQAQLTV